MKRPTPEQFPPDETERERYRAALQLIVDSDGISTAKSITQYARAVLDGEA
jgi:hypothetical protein